MEKTVTMDSNISTKDSIVMNKDGYISENTGGMIASTDLRNGVQDSAKTDCRDEPTYPLSDAIPDMTHTSDITTLAVPHLKHSSNSPTKPKSPQIQSSMSPHTPDTSPHYTRNTSAAHSATSPGNTDENSDAGK